MRTRHAAILSVAALLLGACSSGSSSIGPTDTTSGNGIGSITPQANFHALFQLAQGILPYPNDLYFHGSTDGTLRLPLGVPFLPNAAAINELDGFSTTGHLSVNFSAPIDATTLSAADVAVIRVTLDNATKGPLLPPAAGAQMPRPLVFGVDYKVYVAGAGAVGAYAMARDGGGETLVIEPMHPLDPSTGATNIGYIVLLSNGIKDTSGNAAVPDNDYATVLGGALADLGAGKTSPTCAGLTDPTLNGVCRLTFGHVAIGALLQVANPATVVLSFSFSTQSTSDVLNAVWLTDQATTVAAGTLVAAPTTLTTQELLAAVGVTSPGLADVWAGKLSAPYYLTPASGPHDTAPLTTFWTAKNASPLDATSFKLTRFNPVPVGTTLAMPVLIGVPNARTGCTEPAGGWKTVVFMAGITLDRSYAITVMDRYASQCFVVVAIDLPLHGITDPTSPLYRNQLFTGTAAAGLITGERTFDLDLQNNTSHGAGPDGVIDPAGAWFINLSSLISSRDNLRQAEADLLWLAHALPTLSLGVNINGSSDIDGSQLQIAGESLGSMSAVGALAVANSPYKSGLLSSPGGTIAPLLRDSPDFGPYINAGLAAASHGLLVPYSTAYDNFLRDAQTAVDASDPSNLIASAVANRPILMQRVIGGGVLPDTTLSLPDQVIPPSASQRLVAAANFSRFSAVGISALPAGTGAYVNFLFGHHANIFGPDPSSVTANTLPSWNAVTTEMQTEAVAFAVAQGHAVTLTNTTLLQP